MARLPHVESGLITLLGATTENPSFALNRALLSRARCVVLDPVGAEEIEGVLRVALQDVERGLGPRWAEEGAVSAEALAMTARLADGDVRAALTTLELACACTAEGAALGVAAVRSALQRRALQHDRAGDAHYDTISALHKVARPHRAQRVGAALTQCSRACGRATRMQACTGSCGCSKAATTPSTSVGGW